MLKRFILTPLAAAILSACAVGPDYHAPETKSAEKFDGVESTYSTQEGVAHFWNNFDDATLARLVDEATRSNYDVRIALSRVAQARALRRDAAFDLAPSINAGGGYTKTKFAQDQAIAGTPRLTELYDAGFDAVWELDFFGGGRRGVEASSAWLGAVEAAQRDPPVSGQAALHATAGTPRHTELYDAGFDAFWELDFFGGVRRGVEASSAELGAVEAAERDALVIVTAEVTRTYFELRGFQQQLDVAQRNVVNQQSTLDLAKARLEAGSGTEFDTARAQAQLSATMGTIAPLEAAVARSIHRLSVLVGREPGALRAELVPTRNLPALPGIVPVGDPAGLLRRRPDIRVAERQLAGATARIGVAVADLLPRVTFTGSTGYVSATSGGLGDSGSEAYTIAPRISWGIFDYGHVQARIGAAKWRKEGAVLRYEKTVLQALEETEDSLVTHARARDRLVHDEAAVRA